MHVFISFNIIRLPDNRICFILLRSEKKCFRDIRLFYFSCLNIKLTKEHKLSSYKQTLVNKFIRYSNIIDNFIIKNMIFNHSWSLEKISTIITSEL